MRLDYPTICLNMNVSIFYSSIMCPCVAFVSYHEDIYLKT